MHSSKKFFIIAVACSMMAPMVVFAQNGSVDLGLNYATALGLGTQDIRTTISNVIKSFMGLLGVLAVVIVLLGGFKWMLSGGSEEKVAEAKKMIVSGAIGLIIIMMAFAIAQFVIGAIVNGTTGSL